MPTQGKTLSISKRNAEHPCPRPRPRTLRPSPKGEEAVFGHCLLRPVLPCRTKTARKQCCCPRVLGLVLSWSCLRRCPEVTSGQVRDPTASATLHVAMLTGGGAGGNLSAATAAVLPPEDPPRSASDSQSSIGALYYVIAVVLIYGFSIILLIGSQIRKNKHDRGISRY